MQIYAPAQMIKIGPASKLLGVSKDTLRRWEQSGKLVPIKTPGGTRFYTKDLLSGFNPSSQTKKLLRLPKIVTLTVNFIFTLIVSSSAITAVYLAIPPFDSYVSSSNIKPIVKLGSVQNLDNSHLNKSAKLLTSDAAGLIEGEVPDGFNSSIGESWTLTSEDCVKGIIDRSI